MDKNDMYLITLMNKIRGVPAVNRDGWMVPDTRGLRNTLSARVLEMMRSLLMRLQTQCQRST